MVPTYQDLISSPLPTKSQPHRRPALRLRWPSPEWVSHMRCRIERIRPESRCIAARKVWSGQIQPCHTNSTRIAPPGSYLHAAATFSANLLIKAFHRTVQAIPSTESTWSGPSASRVALICSIRTLSHAASAGHNLSSHYSDLPRMETSRSNHSTHQAILICFVFALSRAERANLIRAASAIISSPNWVVSSHRLQACNGCLVFIGVGQMVHSTLLWLVTECCTALNSSYFKQW